MDSPYQLMEEEILHFHLLVQEMRKESECLRNGSTESLMAPIHSLEIHTREIQKIEASIQTGIEKFLEATNQKGKGKILSTLLPILPPADIWRVKDYQTTPGNLRKRGVHINCRNKTFLQEPLTYWK